MRWEVEFYRTKSGESPVEEFLDKLPPRARAKSIRDMQLLEEFGLELGSPHVKQIKGREKLWELRVQVASDTFRYFYFAFAGCKFVILHGIAKKTQKIPSRDLDMAEKRMKDYFRRFSG